MNITLWGTRGSVPVSGPDFARHGGNTTCIGIDLDGAGKRIVFDCGTGMAELGRSGAWTDTLVLQTHLHWDHVQGFPFFAPLFQRAATFCFLAVDRDGESLEDVLRAQMSRPTFPIELSMLPAALSFESIAEEGSRIAFGDVRLSWAKMDHPSGSTAWRVDVDGASFVFSGDVEVDGGCGARLAALARGADLLVMDAQYFPEEYATRRGWGHSTPGDAVEVALAAGARRLVMTHHDPSHDDTRLEAKLALARELARGTGLVVDNAYDRMAITLSGSAVCQPALQ